MVDATTDVSNHEQVTIVLRWVDNSNFSVHEEFIDLYAVPSLDSSVLVFIIKDTLVWLTCPFLKPGGNVTMVQVQSVGSEMVWQVKFQRRKGELYTNTVMAMH